MTSRNFLVCAAILVLNLLLCGCEGNKQGAPTKPAETPSASLLKVPFKDPVEPDLFELPSGALSVWREQARYRPVLVLYSTHPLLKPITADRKKTVEKLLLKGPTAEIIKRTRFLNANPVVLPPETVSAAIDNGFFSELVIVLPNRTPPAEVDLEGLRNKLLAAGYVSETEAAWLNLKDGIVSGSIRGLPLRIVHPERLPKITTPVVLHIDLGFFKDMYVNEVKTPAYDLLYQVATQIQTASLPTLATTLSFSNQEVEFSLESRFLIRDLATLLQNPGLLAGNTPESWSLRAQALQATTMFAESKARELTQLAAKANPDDAAAQYALALDLFEQKFEVQAFATLDHAVALDRGYAIEYLALAEQGFNMNMREKSLELLRKAAVALPELDFVRIELSRQLLEAGLVTEARPIIAELRKLEWSKEFHPNMPSALEEMAKSAASDVPPMPAVAPPQPGSNRQQPALRMPGFNHMGMPGR